MFRNITLTLMLIAGCGLAQAQMSVMFGPSMVKSFGIQGVYPGFHVGMESGQDDVQSYYARLTFSPSKSYDRTDGVILIAKDPNTVPYSMQLGAREKFNYTSIEFGKRFYFGEGYDSGFSPYGGTNLQATFNKIKLDLDDYDKSKYDIEGNSSDVVGSIFGMYVGLNGGLKKSFYFGTIYLDAGLSYALFAVPSNTLASQTQNYRSLLFNFCLGFRKDFY